MPLNSALTSRPSSRGSGPGPRNPRNRSRSRPSARAVRAGEARGQGLAALGAGGLRARHAVGAPGGGERGGGAAKGVGEGVWVQPESEGTPGLSLFFGQFPRQLWLCWPVSEPFPPLEPPKEAIGSMDF